MAERNTRTLIATFGDFGTACQAARELNDSGVPNHDVYIDSNQKTAGAGSGGYPSDPEQPRFSDWWGNTFGSEREQEARAEYEGALTGGRAVLWAQVTEELTDVSTNILNRNGAVEIETRSPAADSRIGTAGETSRYPQTQGGVRIYDSGSLHPPERRKAAFSRGTTQRRGSDLVQSGFGSTPGSSTLAGEATAGSGIQDESYQDLTEQK